jgi:hypothetical protein
LESDNSGRFVRAPTAISTVVDGIELIVDTNSGRYFGLDDIGAVIWNALREPKALAVVQRTLVAEFDGDADLIAREAEQFIDRLSRNGLVTTL